MADSAGHASHRGVALLLTLLLLVAATLLAHAAFLLTQGEARALVRHRRMVQAWYELESELASGPGERLLPLPGGALLQWAERTVLTPSGPGRDPAVEGGRVWWRLDPEAEVARIEGLVGLPPPGAGPLRLGSHSLGWWLHNVPWEAVPLGGGQEVHRHPPGRVAGPVVLWAPGDLVLPHPLLPDPVEGLILVEGRLHVTGAATVRGGTVTGGGTVVHPPTGVLLPDGALLRSALEELARAAGVLPVPGGWLSPFPW